MSTQADGRRTVHHFAMSVTSNYVGAAATAIASLARNTSAPLTGHIIYAELSEPERARLETAAPPGLTLVYHEQDLPSVISRAGGARLFSHNNDAILLILEAVELLPYDVSRLLIVDVDLLICGSMDQLLEVDLDGRTLGAVQDPYLPTGTTGCNKLVELRGASPGVPLTYFNSGVMIIDASLWRKFDASKTIRLLVDRVGGRLSIPGQDILNAVFHNDWLPLDERWNHVVTSSDRSMTPEDARAALGKTSVAHFAGPLKPWSDDYPDCFWRDLYRSCAV